MLNLDDAGLNSFIGALTHVAQRLRWLIAGATLLMCVAAGTYIAHHIGINTNTADMLSPTLPWRIAYDDYKRAFPFFEDSIAIVVDARTPDLADEAATRLSAALRADPANFASVFNPRAEAFLRHHQLLYAEPDQLESLADTLGSAQALLSRLLAAPGLVPLFGLLEDIATHPEQAAGTDSARFNRTIAAAIDELLAGDTSPLSWQNLLTDATSKGPDRVIFTAQPTLDYSAILPGEKSIAALRAAIAKLGYADDPSVRVRLTGAAALAEDELTSVIRGATQAGTLAFVMVAVCLGAGLRSLSLVIATLLSLIAGLVFTACFAAAAVGTLNMISVAFAVLYVGLGVDFAIHLGLRYQELCLTLPQSAALNAAARHVGGSIAFCALTTAIAFFAFIPTSYQGVAELGLISGVGMLIGLTVSLTLLPALLAILPAPRPRALPPVAARRLSESAVWTRNVALLAALLGIAAMLLLPRVSFDMNPLHLNDPAAESVTTIADLAADGQDPLHTISVLVDDIATRDRLLPRLAALETVAAVRSLNDLVPKEQAEKLAILEDLRYSLGDDLLPGAALPLALDEIEASITSLRAVSGATAATDVQRLGVALAALQARLDAGDRAQALALMKQLEVKLLHHFRPQMERLHDALDADEVTVATLPAALRERWVAGDGRQRIEIQPRGALHTNAEMIEFVDSVRAVAGNGITDTPVINLAASRAVKEAFYEAFTGAAILITLLLWLLVRRWVEVMILLAPLALAGLLTAASSVLLDLPFNFANIIALPLLLGIGVDSALHILHRYKTMGPDPRALHQTSTARAVLLSALTTTASFGNLAVSPHAGTASMGIMLSVGLGTTLLCTLVVLPALLQRFVPADAVS